MTAPLPSLAFCVIGDTAIFLDIAGDRYFRLPSDRNAAFVSALAGTAAGGKVLRAAGLDRFADGARVTMPHLSNAERRSPDLSHVSVSPLNLVRAIVSQRTIERRVRSQGLFRVLGQLHNQLHAGVLEPILAQKPALQIVAAFAQGRLVRSAVDRCLPRSIALAHMLGNAGYRTEVIIGVKLRPFAAHCWVQSGSFTLNESAQEADRYTPILVL
ncbi:MAG: lasso peptide biosynthesis B2 protein [Novosphingobium sp.]|uniref:lasso peptide biosynthesis B2 protein n=1 Tax=Novosphingobium sp. TaxID=1874826 RepID=UPI002736F22E|nr:lasso peptide biosynthesis B2 protein [Novosphingobium sp.]MDP3551125.1 lasso peptide biosynthesis B2 protein [Novosphingobium sp.]